MNEFWPCPEMVIPARAVRRETRGDEQSRRATPKPQGVAAPTDVDEHLVSLLNPTSFEAEQYRTLRHMVEQMNKDAHLNVMAVTSPAVGDGKTMTAINLAGALAQNPEARVLLVDADVRRPSVGARLGLGESARPGLVDAILNPGLALEDAVHRLPCNLSVLTAGPVLPAPYEVLKSPRLGELLEQARHRYDSILLDTPPVVPVPDCRLIAKRIDGFLVVVAAHMTPRKLLEEALNILEPSKIIGLIFNSDDRPLSGYYGYYYVHGQSPDDDPLERWIRVVKKAGHLLWRRGSSGSGTRPRHEPWR